MRTGIVLAFQSYSEFLRYNTRFHRLILEGGFDKLRTIFEKTGHLS
ncbi:MAG: hypothetical protein JW864_12960 [Spirochaetes bacterium]|nr:hypothetical protein [Spirochaetota bacterium]